jgi:hypothetical protein
VRGSIAVLTGLRAEIGKPACEACGSLKIKLKEARPDPLSVLNCGGRGPSKGALQSLRETPIRADRVSFI